MTDLDLDGRRLLIRQDLNVPLAEGGFDNHKRIDASISSILQALERGASVTVMSHLGQPEAGRYSPDHSLSQLANLLSKKLDKRVNLITDLADAHVATDPDSINLLENVRFHTGEIENDPALSQSYANLCDIYVMDAFGAAHRAHASTCGVADYAPIACAGPLLAREVDILNRALHSPQQPLVAVIGGAKIATKLNTLLSLAKIADVIIAGGVIANTLLLNDHPIGQSLCDQDAQDQVRTLREAIASHGTELLLPSDVIVSGADGSGVRTTNIDDVADHEMIFDIGPQSAQHYAAALKKAGTIIWNGPVGRFEIDAFASGTRALAEAIAQSKAFSLAGGGETLSIIERYSLGEHIDYESTGGGAFLHYIGDETSLPALNALYRAGGRAETQGRLASHLIG